MFGLMTSSELLTELGFDMENWNGLLYGVMENVRELNGMCNCVIELFALF